MTLVRQNSLMAIESKMRRPSAFGQTKEGSSGPWRLVAVLFLLAVLAAGAWYWWTSRPESSIPSGTYQAVFLDNGQTYFGRLDWRDSPHEGYVRLREVYYLDFRQNPQDPSVSASDLKLTKLGGEVHGPEDFMDVNADHVLYVEDLRGDSKIAQAIAEYSAKNPEGL